MQVKNVVFEKILEEEKKHGELEFGGWLVIDNGIVSDIIFDTKKQSIGYVKFDSKNLLAVPKKTRNRVRGWFHKHPINGLSGLDWKTTFKLTQFWKECYTLVLQANRKVLAMKTAYGKEISTVYPDFMPQLNWSTFFEIDRSEFEVAKCQTDSKIK